MTATEIVRHLHGHKSGAGYVAKCPAHEDKNPSLSIRDAGNGKVLVHCHAGCDQGVVIEALKSMGLWPEPEQRPEVIEAIYGYTDEAGNLLYEIVRKSGKKFQQRYPDGAGGWVWKKHPRQVLYHIREVLETPIIFVVEGERDVETLRDYGFVATTNAGGAKAPWLESYTDALANHECIIIPDNDGPGWEHAKRVAAALLGRAADVIILDDIHRHGAKDISAWFEAGHSECELISMLEQVYAG